MLLNELWLEFWGVEVVVENFVDMCKFYFMNIAQFCGYAYGKLLWVWQFYGYEILAIKKKKKKNLCWVCDVGSWTTFVVMILDM